MDIMAEQFPGAFSGYSLQVTLVATFWGLGWAFFKQNYIILVHLFNLEHIDLQVNRLLKFLITLMVLAMLVLDNSFLLLVIEKRRSCCYAEVTIIHFAKPKL